MGITGPAPFRFERQWFSRALRELGHNPNLFDSSGRESAQHRLGLGSRQVLALEYWLKACGLTTKQGQRTLLTELGEVVAAFDPRLEERESWLVLHHKLSANRDGASTYWLAFRLLPDVFSRAELQLALRTEFPGLRDRTYDDAVTVFFSICMHSEISTLCHLVSADLNQVRKNHDPEIPTGVVAFLLADWAERVDAGTAHFGDILGPQGPLRPFGVSPRRLPEHLQLIQERYSKQVLWFSQTAGLNSVTFPRRVPPVRILRALYRERRDGLSTLAALEAELAERAEQG